MNKFSRYVAAYEAMDDEARDLALDIVEEFARDWPAPRRRPELHLVAECVAKGTLGSFPRDGLDSSTPTVRSKPVLVK
jgi:hypothetical protein